MTPTVPARQISPRSTAQILVSQRGFCHKLGTLNRSTWGTALVVLSFVLLLLVPVPSVSAAPSSADLVISNVSNNGCTVSWEVTNQGGTSTVTSSMSSASSSLASDPTFDQFVATVQPNSTVAVLPVLYTSAPVDRTITITADSSEWIAEDDENNNTVTFVLPANCDNGLDTGADLVVQNVHNVGCEIHWTVRNVGTGSTNYTSVTGSSFTDANGSVSSIVSTTPVLAPFGAAAASAAYALEPFDRTFFITADKFDAVAETNETNNTTTFVLPANCGGIPPGVADLIVVAGWNTDCEVTVMVLNQGNGPSVGNGFVKMLATLSIGGGLSQFMPVLNPGEVWVASALSDPLPVVPSPITVNITLDTLQSVNESDETNNTFEFEIPPYCDGSVGPICSAVYVNVRNNDGTFSVFQVDDNGDLAQDFGSFGLSRIADIAWLGDTLYATGRVGNINGIYELDLASGTSTLAIATNSRLGIGGGTTLVSAVSTTAVNDLDLSANQPWSNQVSIPTFGPNQKLADVAVNPFTGERYFSVRAGQAKKLFTQDSNGNTQPNVIDIPFLVGLADRGGSLIGVNSVGKIWEIDPAATSNALTLVSGIPDYYPASKAWGAASYWEASECDPW